MDSRGTTSSMLTLDGVVIENVDLLGDFNFTYS